MKDHVLLTGFGALFAGTSVLVGAGFLLGGVLTGRRLRRDLRVRHRAVPVQARVTAVRTVVSRRDDEYRPIDLTTVEFEDRTERTYSVELQLPQWEPPTPGERVAVLYDPQNPNTVLPQGRVTDVAAALMATLLTVAGVTVLLLVVVVLTGLLQIPGVTDDGGVFDDDDGTSEYWPGPG